MPTLQKPQLDHKSFDWASDNFGQCVESNREKILSLLNFDAEYGDLPHNELARKAHREEEDGVLREIAGILALAAAIYVDGGTQPVGKVRATLHAIERNPSLLSVCNVEPRALGLVTKHYQRADETAGTHWYDITGDGPDHLRQVPSHEAVHAAARRAYASIDAMRGRRANPLNIMLAERLGSIFLRFNPSIGRTTIDDTDAGPFYDFAECVLQPLNRYLHTLPAPLTRVHVFPARIARIASELWPHRVRRTDASDTQFPPEGVLATH